MDMCSKGRLDRLELSFPNEHVSTSMGGGGCWVVLGLVGSGYSSELKNIHLSFIRLAKPFSCKFQSARRTVSRWIFIALLTSATETA